MGAFYQPLAISIARSTSVGLVSWRSFQLVVHTYPKVEVMASEPTASPHDVEMSFTIDDSILLRWLSERGPRLPIPDVPRCEVERWAYQTNRTMYSNSSATL